MEQKVKLTVRVDPQHLSDAKEYAARHGTSLSRLISEFLGTLEAESRQPQPPILRKLSGILPLSASPEEHRLYLRRKYGG